VKWESTPVSVSVDDALADAGRRRGEHGEDDTSELEDAKTWLADALGAGPVAAKEIYSLARGDGISKRTLDRAKKILNVTTAKASGVTNGGWMWSLGDGKQLERQVAKSCQPEGCHTPEHEIVGNVGNLGNLPEKANKTTLFEAPEIEGCQHRQGCQDGQDHQERQERQLAAKFDTKLDPDQPGPTDRLTPEQYKRYQAIYYSRLSSMSPAEKHARAWRAAVKE